MQIIPHSKQGWLRFAVLPFKAYVLIAPILFLISIRLPHPRHSGATDAEVFLVLGLSYCSIILFLAALIFALAGPKGFALPCVGFAVAAFIITCLLLPSLASS